MKLVSGQGSEKTGACWMSAIHYYVRKGTSWTDQPECVSPFIRRLCIRLNDFIKTDARREELIGPHLFTPVGTNTGEADERKRYYLAADRAIHVFSPFWLRRTKNKELICHAEILEKLPPIVDKASAEQARAFAQSAAYAADAADAAYAGARKFVETNLLALILDCCAIGQKSEVCPTKTKSEVTEFLCSFDGVRKG